MVPIKESVEGFQYESSEIETSVTSADDPGWCSGAY